ncbi:hypothetical protein KF728_28355 [Candidatus Obscuribacterales bacterium]|nr:hypothetical protein [Candidatus Obscuribacterales bacterium]
MSDARPVSDGAVINLKPTTHEMSSMHKESWQYNPSEKKQLPTKEPANGTLEFDDIYKSTAHVGKPVDSFKATKISEGKMVEKSVDKTEKPFDKTHKLDGKTVEKNLDIEKNNEKKPLEKEAKLKKLTEEDIIALKKKLGEAGGRIGGSKCDIKPDFWSGMAKTFGFDSTPKCFSGSIGGHLERVDKPEKLEKLNPQYIKPPVKDMAEVERQNIIDRKKFEQSMTPEQLKKIEEMKKKHN